MSSRQPLLPSSSSTGDDATSPPLSSSSSCSSSRFRFFIFLTVVSTLMLFSAYSFPEVFSYRFRSSSAVIFPRGTLISTSGCKILDFDPFHPSLAEFIDVKRERRLICSRSKKDYFLVIKFETTIDHCFCRQHPYHLDQISRCNDPYVHPTIRSSIRLSIRPDCFEPDRVFGVGRC